MFCSPEKKHNRPQRQVGDCLRDKLLQVTAEDEMAEFVYAVHIQGGNYSQQTLLPREEKDQFLISFAASFPSFFSDKHSA